MFMFDAEVCKAGLANARKIWLTRHGESVFNKEGLIGGDSPLSAAGEEYARQLPAVLFGRIHEVYRGDAPVSISVLTSTLQRTIQTARYLPFPKLRWKALDEIDAGICDGLSYEEISEQHPEEFKSRGSDKLRYRYPRGESYMDVIQRVEPVVTEMERGRESICIVGHQAVLRAVYGYFMNVPPEAIPSIEMPLHTLIELTPMPDGTMKEERFAIDIAGTATPHHLHCGRGEAVVHAPAMAVA